jgi:hypothetical protein
MICDLECSNKALWIFKVLTTVFGLISTFIIANLIRSHMRHFTNRYFQSKIIGGFFVLIFKKILLCLTHLVIIMIVPVYCLTSILGTLFIKSSDIAEVLSIARSMYEAVLIVSFFQLIVAYSCYCEKVSFSYINITLFSY